MSEASLKAKWDTQNAFDSVRREEQAKAYAEKLKSAAKMKRSRFDNAMIADILELPIEVVEKL